MASTGKQALVGRRERTSLKAPAGEAMMFRDELCKMARWVPL